MINSANECLFPSLRMGSIELNFFCEMAPAQSLEVAIATCGVWLELSVLPPDEYRGKSEEFLYAMAQGLLRVALATLADTTRRTPYLQKVLQRVQGIGLPAELLAQLRHRYSKELLDAASLK